MQFDSLDGEAAILVPSGRNLACFNGFADGCLGFANGLCGLA
jgi:hypothetical protein